MVPRGRGGGGPPRRPPIKKVSSARLGRIPRRPRVIVRPEGIRYLRADGTPNWENLGRISEGEVKLLASHPAVTVSTSSNILEAAEIIAEKRVRGLPVVKAGSEVLAGLVTALDIVNYLGGGEYYNIVLSRHRRNIYSALRDEGITSIANPTPAYVYVTDKLRDVVELMITTGIGLIPVLWEDGSVYGVITEHDVVKHLAGKRTDVKVSEIATRSVVMVEIEATIKRAAEVMVSNGFRRLPVYNPADGSVKGMINAKDIVAYFGSHEAFKAITSTDIEEALSTPVYEIMTPGVYTVNEETDAGEVAKHMIDLGVNSLLVVREDDSQVIGIVTERDVLGALIMGGE